MNALTTWMQARESLRQRKAADKRPWTDDPILKAYRFCNIRRRDDRVSQWILQHVVSLPVPVGSLGLPQLGMFLALCRWVNWPPTIKEWLFRGQWPSQRPDWTAMGDVVDRICDNGEQAWTGAFMVRGEQKSHGHAWAHWGKGRYVADIVVRREMTLAAHQLRDALRVNTRQAVATVLQNCYGWGPFMAGQVVDDWTWTPLLKDATDHYTWAPQGPGSLRGLNRLHGLPLSAKWEDEKYLHALRQLREEVISELGTSFSDITLHDISNGLCETDKYERVRLGEGRPRSYYKPETAY